MDQLRSFIPHVDESVLADLQSRLERARWPVEPQAGPWRYGTSQDYLQRLIARWRGGYDWRKTERRLGAFENYKANVGGLEVHFLLERGSGPHPRPLVLTHGWPGSIVEFLHVIEPLAHPERFGGQVEDAFTVVVPSIPGYGFSQAPAAPLTPRAIAQMWRDLMVDVLGFQTYFAQGGDWGSIISTWMAHDHPQHVKALHLNFMGVLAQPDAGDATPEEADWMVRNVAWRQPEDGYRTQQATRPHTLAYALTDSPLGLAAWIVEKFQAWSPATDNGDPPFEMDVLLDNLMLYWIPGPGAASWLYASSFEHDMRRFKPHERVTVPTGVLLCPRDTLLQPPDSLIRRSYNLVRRTDAPTGGHFAALEQPGLFVREVREFFRPYAIE